MNLPESGRRIFYSVLALLALTVLSTLGLSGCGGTSTAPGSEVVLKSISIHLPATQFARGTTGQVQIQATLSDGSTQDVTSLADYSSSAPSIATISTSGKLAALSVGTSVIAAAYKNQGAMVSVTITAATVTSLSLTSSTSSLAVGSTAQVQATATYTDGTTGSVTGAATYTSSDTSVATVDASGKITAVATGTSTIAATYQGQTASTSITVTAAPIVVQSIGIKPATAQLAKGNTLQLQTTATHSNGATTNVTSQAAYTSSAASVATVSAAGVVTGVSAGTATITANYQGKSATAGITVTAPTATSISLTSSANSLAAGATAQLQATATYADGTTGNITGSATYTSSNPSVATVNASGLITAVSPGTAVITAAYEGKTATATITVSTAVTQSIVTTAGATQLAKGTTTQLQTIATLTNGTTRDVTSQATYTSSAPAVATVSASGVITGVSIGSAVITAGYQGKTATFTITITAATATAISLTSSGTSIPLGSSAQLQATATYTDGTTGDVTTTATYTSSSPSTATVNASGQITSVSQGTSVVTATYEGQSATVTITVTAAAIVSISINPGAIQSANGTTRQLQALAAFTDGSLSDVTATATWSTSPSVATISASGLLTAVGTGTATVTATQSGVSGTTNLTVTGATLQGIVLLPVNLSVSAGGTLQITAQGVFTDGSSQGITDKLSFATSDPSVATVSSSGLLSGVTPGSVTITATANAGLGSKTTSISLAVTSATLQSIVVSPSTAPVAHGTCQQMSVLGTLSDGSSEDLTQSVAWASSDTHVAIVDIHGVVTGLNAGTATITANIAGVPTASATVTVSSASIVSLTITPGDITLAVGQNLQVGVTATFSNGTTQDVTTAAALTVSGGLGSVLVNPISNARMFSAILAGTGTLTATVNGHTSQATLTIGPSQITGISLPATISVAVGASSSLQVQAQYTDGSSHLLTTNLSFSSNAAAIVSLDTLGNVTGTSPGTAVVSAIYNNPSGGTFSASTSVTVTTATLTAITLTAGGSVDAVGIPIQLYVVGTYSDGSVLNITSQVHFTSSDPSIAVVNNVGLVTTAGVGSAQITATLSAVTATLNLNVGNAVVQSIAVNAPSTLPIGAGSHLTAVGTFSDASQQDISSLVTWSSSSPALGVVDSTGDATGIALGTFNAVATLNGISGEASVQVTAAVPATLTSITVTPNSVNLVNSVLSLLGVTVSFTATGHYSDGSTRDLTSTVQWSTSNGSLCAISSHGLLQFTLEGLLSLVGLGQNTISAIATLGSVSGSANVFLTVL